MKLSPNEGAALGGDTGAGGGEVGFSMVGGGDGAMLVGLGGGGGP